jgi:cell shape-determining protein MreC
MKRKANFLPVFLVVFFLCIAILILSIFRKIDFLSSFLGKGAGVVQSTAFGIYQKFPFISEDLRIKKLEDRNLELLSNIAAFEKLKRENLALLDQFKTSHPQSTQLLSATIIGMTSFIPGVSTPTDFIINKGSEDNLKVGSAVVIKDNIIGIVSKVSTNLSKVNTINDPLFSFTAKTRSGAIGVIKNKDGIILDNILLSENLTIGEIILTKGDINDDGIGIPPDLIVGKIMSVEKNPSDLFQKAKIESFVNFVNLSTVFVYMQIK